MPKSVDSEVAVFILFWMVHSSSSVRVGAWLFDELSNLAAKDDSF